jgi:hypothetical protein
VGRAIAVGEGRFARRDCVKGQERAGSINYPIRSSETKGIFQPGRRKTVIEAAKRYNVDILAVTEAGLADYGKLDLGDGYQLLWSGPSVPPLSAAHPEPLPQVRNNGVAMILSPAAYAAMEEWKPYSERHLVVKLRGTEPVVAVAYYAPHSGKPKAARDAHARVTQEIRSCYQRRCLYLELGDANAKVGSAVIGEDYVSSSFGGAIGCHGIGTRNDAGKEFAAACTANNLAIANTFFKHPPVHKLSYCTSNPVVGLGADFDWNLHLNDLIVIDRSFLSSVMDVKVKRGANRSKSPTGGVHWFTFSNHHLVVATIKMRLRGIQHRAPRPSIPMLARHAHLAELYVDAAADELRKSEGSLKAALEAEDVATAWGVVAAATRRAAAKVIPLEQRCADRPPPTTRMLELVRERLRLRSIVPRTPALHQPHRAERPRLARGGGGAAAEAGRARGRDEGG